MYHEDDFDVVDGFISVGSSTKKAKAFQILAAACGENEEPPPAIMELDYEKFGVYCWAYVMNKLELKQRERLFVVLEFMAMMGPTSIMIKLVYQFSKQLLLLPKKWIDKVCLAIIRGSKYSIAASLKMAAFAQEMGDIDLSSKDAFTSLSTKYTEVAVELTKQIESHHLLGM